MGLRCDFLRGRDSCHGFFFTLKTVGAITGTWLRALWLAGTVALAGPNSALVVAALVHPSCIQDMAPQG